MVLRLYYQVSNPIGTKFKYYGERFDEYMEASFKSHRDKVQMPVVENIGLSWGEVSNPIGTKFKWNKREI